MENELRRNRAVRVEPPNSDGTATCQLGDRTVRLHRDLASRVREGDEVLVAGELHGEHLHALALRNFTQSTVTAIDHANMILTLGLGGFVTLLVFILAVQEGGNSSLWETLYAVSAVIGFGVVVAALRRLLCIERARRWVQRVRE